MTRKVKKSHVWLVSGSRDFPDEALARSVMARCFKKGDIVYHGAARGVDTWAHEVAMRIGCKIRRFPVTREEWTRHGRSAGILRNDAMCNRWSLHKDGIKRALIIWDGVSHGTKYMKRNIEFLGFPMVLLHVTYD